MALKIIVSKFRSPIFHKHSSIIQRPSLVRYLLNQYRTTGNLKLCYNLVPLPPDNYSMRSFPVNTIKWPQFAPFVCLNCKFFFRNSSIRVTPRQTLQNKMSHQNNGPPTYGFVPPPSAPPSYAQAVGGVQPSSPFKSSGGAPQTIVTTVVPIGPQTTHMICPNCHAEINTATKSSPGLIAYVSGLIIAMLG